MNFLTRLSIRLFVNQQQRAKIRDLEKHISEQSGDMLALSHQNLYTAYRALAEKNKLLSPFWEHVAWRHLEDAVLIAKAFPQPRVLLATRQLQAGNFWDCRDNLTKAIALQRIWVENLKDEEGQYRLGLCRYLALAGSTEFQLGQLRKARDFFIASIEQLALLTPELRLEQKDLQTSICSEMLGSFVLEHNYTEAIAFIDSNVGHQNGLPDVSQANITMSRPVLETLASETRDFQSPSGSEQLWAKFMDDIQRAETVDALRDVKGKLLTVFRTHEINQAIHEFASAVERLMNERQTKLKDAQERSLKRATPQWPDLTGMKDSQRRGELERRQRRFQAMIEQSNRTHAKHQKRLQSVYTSARNQLAWSIASVRKMADNPSKISLKHRFQWFALNVSRSIVQIVAVAYFLDTVIGGFLEETGQSLAHVLALKHKELIIASVVLIIGFIAGKLLERKLDAWFVPKYKALLTGIIIDRFNSLWVAYNTLLKLPDKVQRAAADAEAKGLQTV